MSKVKQLADELYNQKVLDGWKNVSMETCLKRATDYYRTDKKMEEARELLLKHLYLQGGDGLGISDGKVYNACFDVIMEALTIPVVNYCYECNKPYDDKDREHGMCHKCRQPIIEEQLHIPVVSYYVAQQYAEFCVRCDRENLPLIKTEDYLKQL